MTQAKARPRRSVAAQKAALAAAEVRCRDLGEAWTTPRSGTYELLLRARGPRTAYELIAGLKRGARYVGPPTVYRALDFLQRAGLAHRVESRKGYVACAVPGTPHAAAFLICDACGQTDELIQDLDLWRAAAPDFALAGAILEMRGLCPACRANGGVGA